MSHAIVLDDTAAARQELANSQYGVHPNAEELIRAQYASMSPELRSAVRLPENEEMKAELKEQKAAGKIEVPEGGRLVDWTVRGRDRSRAVIVYVWEDKQGNYHRGLQGATSDYEPPEESPQDKSVREIAMHDARAREAAIDANVEIDAKVAELRADLTAEMGERFQSLKDDLVSTLKEIAGGADKPVVPQVVEGSGPATGTDASPGGKGEPDEQQQGGAGGGGGGGAGGSVGTATGETPTGGGGAASSGDLGDEGGSGGEKSYPRQHAELDKLLSKSDQPEGWEDMKVDQKIDYLRERQIAPKG